jgi:hypothetical protein
VTTARQRCPNARMPTRHGRRLSGGAAGSGGRTSTAASGFTPKMRSSTDDVLEGAVSSGLLIHRRAARSPRFCHSVRAARRPLCVPACSTRCRAILAHMAAQGKAGNCACTLLVSRSLAWLIDSSSSWSCCSYMSISACDCSTLGTNGTAPPGFAVALPNVGLRPPKVSGPMFGEWHGVSFSGSTYI